jgi:hypothetical protein
MATDAFIKVHSREDGAVRVNTHRLLYYAHQGEGTRIYLNIAGVILDVIESPEEIDAMVVMAKDKEHKK